MDQNHRGGPQGFIRVHNPPESTAEDETATKPTGSVIVWPEYSGNNLYQTLGNLVSTPRAGLCIPDFSSGDVLYLTGTTEVLIGNDAASVIAKSKLAVKLTVTHARHVSRGLPFRGTNIDDAAQGRSPYNPRVRYLTTEKQDELAGTTAKAAQVTAHLVKKTALTPTITRYRLALSDPGVYGPWKPGQYVALDFSGELDLGYSHMRDDDPTSLNDDFLRTFTVSSVPGSLGMHGEEFEMTVRKVGNVTGFLSWQREGMLEVGVVGFGGEFKFDFSDEATPGSGRNSKKVGFIAAGIGITPLLGQMGTPEMSDGLIAERVRVLWTLGVRDVNLALDIVQTFPRLKDVMTVFITGDERFLLDDNQDYDHDHDHDDGAGTHKHKHAKKHTKKHAQPDPPDATRQPRHDHLQKKTPKNRCRRVG